MESETFSEQGDILHYILGESRRHYSPEQQELIRRAYELAVKAHEGQFRKSGEPYVTHCVETAKILAEIIRDPVSIAAGLLHDTLEDTSTTYETLEKEFPNTPIAMLVDGVTKISTLKIHSARDQQIETYRHLLLAMAKDLRVIIIKLADRMHNMRTLHHLSAEKQQVIAQETLSLYSALAGRLGMARVKAELEDLSMKYLYPEEYQRLSDQLLKLRDKHETVIQKMINLLRAELGSHGIEAEIQGRRKHLYSIWKKMQRQQVGLESVYDIMAVRVICSGSVDTCYTILGLIHNKWLPIPGRFRDFIATPKENGYRSLHTTVWGPENERIEIQIRTREMHRIAEEGVAAHWRYKEQVSAGQELQEKLQWVRRLVEWLQEVRDPKDFLDSVRVDLGSETVFCFTPRGDIIELPMGSTALDFAYYIHTSVGQTCTGARVNGILVPLRHELRTGDIVEIITAPKAHPSPDWLQIVKTSRARTKIKHWLRQQRLSEENIQKGKDALAKALRARNLPVDWDELQKRVAPFLKNYQVQSFDELCGEIGFGALVASNVVSRAFPEIHHPKEVHKKSVSREKKSQSGGVVLAGGIRNVTVKYAQCCNPVAGDPIIGFVVAGGGMTIHRCDCRILKRLREDPNLISRFQQVEWDANNPPIRKIGIRVECTDRAGLLSDVSSAITESNAFILESKTRSKQDTAVLNFVVQIRNTQHLSLLFSNVKSVKGVVRVSRL